jgi:hypothetical protein
MGVLTSHCSRTRDCSYVESSERRRTILNQPHHHFHHHEPKHQRRTTRFGTSTIHDDQQHQQQNLVQTGGVESAKARGIKSAKRRLDQEFSFRDAVDVVYSGCPVVVRPESSSASAAVVMDNTVAVVRSTSRSVCKDEKEKELHKNYEKRLLKVFQDDEIRQRQMIATAISKGVVSTNNNKSKICRKRGKKCSSAYNNNTNSFATISSKVKSLWPTRARKSTITTRNNKGNDMQHGFVSLSERRDISSEVETTCRDRSSFRTLGEVSLSAVGSNDDEDDYNDVHLMVDDKIMTDDDNVMTEGPSIVFQTPVPTTTTTTGDRYFTTPSKGQQSSLLLPVLNTSKNRMVNENKEEKETREPRMTPISQLSFMDLENNIERESSQSMKTTSSSLPYNRTRDSAILARRMQLGAIRTVAMDGIVESFPDIHDMVVVVQERSSDESFAKVAGGTQTTTYTQLSLPEHCPSHHRNSCGLVVIPASPEEYAYYTTSLPPSESLQTSRRGASTQTLSWL